MEPLPGFKLTSWERGYGDMKLVPDLATWRLLPWLPKTALVFCDVYTEEGEPIEEAPRWVLTPADRARGARSATVVKTASELELYLFKESFDEARAKRYHGLTPVSNYLEDYHILQTSKEEPLVRAIRNGMEAARVPVEFSKGEWGRGQEEINLRYADALEMADRHVLYKHGVKEIAWQQGCSVTFMAKYDMGAAGSSFHLHSSVWDRRGRQEPVRGARTAAGRARRSSSSGWPARWRWRASSRTSTRPPSTPTSATRPAPSRRPASRAGWDNRTCGFRLCGEGGGFRVENRIPGADANPYLAFAATIAAGLHGVAQKLTPPAMLRGQRLRGREAAPRCRRRCARRSASSSGSKVAREAFGTEGRGALPPARPARAAGVRPVRHRLGADPPLRANLGRHETGRPVKSADR